MKVLQTTTFFKDQRFFSQNGLKNIKSTRGIFPDCVQLQICDSAAYCDNFHALIAYVNVISLCKSSTSLKMFTGFRDRVLHCTVPQMILDRK